MNMGGKSGALLFWMQYLTLHGATRISQVMENWVLALWSGKYEFDSDTNVPAARYVPDTPPSLNTKQPWLDRYLSFYTSVTCFTLLLSALTTISFVYGAIRASRRIHTLLMNSVLGSTLRYVIPSRLQDSSDPLCQTM